MGTVAIGKEMEKHFEKLCENLDYFYKTPDIRVNLNKLTGDEDKEDIIFAVNGALFNRNDFSVGYAGDWKKLYFKNDFEEPESIRWEDITETNFVGRNKNGRYSMGDVISLTTSTGGVYEMKSCLTGSNCRQVIRMIDLICQFVRDNEIRVGSPYETKKMSLEDLPDEIVCLYMKVLYNYAYLDDMKFDKEEQAALRSIGVRLGIKPKVRSELLEYMMNTQHRIKTGVIINTMRSNLSYGTYELFRFSLMQDILYVHEVTKKDILWYNDAFINSLQKSLDISDMQIECMLIAIRLYSELQKSELDDMAKIESDMKKMQEQAERLWMPRESLFCSGSIYSIDKYHTFFGKKRNRRSVTLQRELMLQAVIENSQESVNQLVEELNNVTVRLVDAVEKGNCRELQIEEMKERINTIIELNREKGVRARGILTREKVIKPIPIKEMERSGHKNELLSYYTLNRGKKEYVLRDGVSPDTYGYIARLREVVYD